MQITYLFDPLCGWCYGAGPAVERLAHVDGIELELAPSGLFADDGARSMDANFAAYAWQNDQRIARLTGQPFTDAYRAQVLGAADSLFDSAPATLAIVAVGLTEPSREFEALKALQRARYVDGRNNASIGVVADVLDEAGFADAAGGVRAPDDALLAAYRYRIESARADMTQFGARAVPALIVNSGTTRHMLPGNLLFGPFDLLTAQLQTA